ncbi:MAG: hypothetical protein KJ882_11560 [Proteobacteria bacterium]|nr:hypothetical protein [Pseudomonadota bacterium]
MENLKEQTISEIKPEILNAFNVMWGNFPFVVMLLKENRTIVAINKKAKEMGIQPGLKCHQLSGSTGVHKVCMANEALKEQVSKRVVAYSPQQKQVLDSYWVPVVGENDLYVHFATDITDYAKPELFQASE